MPWILISAALAGEPQSFSSEGLRAHVTQTQRQVGGDLLVAAWSIAELRAATEGLEVEGLSLESMGQSAGRSWLSEREDCVLLVQRLDTNSWQVEAFGDCSTQPPPPMREPRRSMPRWHLGVSAGHTLPRPVLASALSAYTGFEFGYPFARGVRLSVMGGGAEWNASWAALSLEALGGWELKRQRWTLGGGMALDERLGNVITLSVAWQFLGGVPMSRYRGGHGLMLRTWVDPFDPPAVPRVELAWTWRAEWRVP